jgi:site-specific DNA recombinase
VSSVRSESARSCYRCNGSGKIKIDVMGACQLGRLYAAIEGGIADPTDATLKERLAVVKTERDIAQVAFDRALAETRPEARITQEKIAKFVDVMRTNVMTGETPFRRAYIRAMVDQVEVDDEEIRIIGRRTVLERLVMGGGVNPAGVPSFVRKWRARNDFERPTLRFVVSFCPIP